MMKKETESENNEINESYLYLYAVTSAEIWAV